MAFALLGLLTALAQEGVHVDPATGEVTLRSDMSEMVEHSRSRAAVVGDMTVFRGRLFATGVLEYSVSEDAWKEAFPGRSTFMLRVAGDRLVSPFWAGGGLRLFDGMKTEDSALPPGQLHTMDVAEFAGKLYASTGGSGCGMVFESADAGRTWKEIRRTRENGRVLDMVVFQGSLYANERGMRLIRWDGKAWEEIPVSLPGVEAKLGNAHLFAFKGKILATNIGMYYTFDGNRWGSKATSFADLWVEGDEVFGLTEEGQVEKSGDGLAWRRVTKTGVPAEQISGSATRVAVRPLQTGCLAIHRGRLFAGTSVQGRIYASTYLGRGRHEGAPMELPAGYAVQLEWEAVVPDGTALRLRCRSAAEKGGLAGAPWREIAGPSPFPLSPKEHRWVQVDAAFESDGRRTPVLGRIRVAARDK